MLVKRFKVIVLHLILPHGLTAKENGGPALAVYSRETR